MKRVTLLFAFVFSLFLNNVIAQNNNSCAHCKMDVKDKLHKAEATIKEKTLHFDAIECLINYLKTKNESDFSSLNVADYKTGELINAVDATFLKSKAIPSPMGAYLSAFKSKEAATKVVNKEGGELYSWKSIKEKFENSNFGALHHNHHRPDAHAPIGVMGDHLHEKGGFMISLRYMNMIMDGNKSGTNDISDASIYNSFMVAPQHMTMDMYMLGIMYAPSNNITLMLMQNFAKKNMDLTAQMMMGGMTMLRDFSTKSSGLGDLKIGALYQVFNTHKTSLHFNSSINIPVGEIENRGDTPMMNNIKLPYAMQLGSGTFDITLGATYKENFTNTSWGTQLLSTLRTGTNGEDYRFGNLYRLNIWGAYHFATNFSVSGRLLGATEGKLKGVDTELNPMMVTTANTSNYGADKIKAFIGLNISFPETSTLKDVRFGIEAGAPIYEDYNGIQMDEDVSISFGLKYSI